MTRMLARNGVVSYYNGVIKFVYVVGGPLPSPWGGSMGLGGLSLGSLLDVGLMTVFSVPCRQKC